MVSSFVGFPPADCYGVHSSETDRLLLRTGDPTSEGFTSEEQPKSDRRDTQRNWHSSPAVITESGPRRIWGNGDFNEGDYLLSKSDNDDT